MVLCRYMLGCSEVATELDCNKQDSLYQLIMMRLKYLTKSNIKSSAAETPIAVAENAGCLGASSFMVLHVSHDEGP